MFNKKLVNMLCYVLVALVLLKLSLDLVIFVWTFFAMPGWAQNQTVGKVFGLLTNVGTVLFIYVLIAGLRSMVMGGSSSSAPRPAAMPFVRRPAPPVHHAHKK